MKNLKLAYYKLSNINSDVSIHYLISRGGLIYNMLCPKFKAWHAGISKWKKNTNINDYSIGIELENEGHDYEYLNFTKKQYLSLKKLANFLKKNYYITDPNFIFHSDISPNRKKDPGEKFNLNKIGIDRFKYLNTTKNMSYKINDMLSLYGFHKSDIKYNQKYCIMSVKRSLNYKKISPNISKNFIKNFYNLLFH